MKNDTTLFTFPEEYAWGTPKHAELLAERQELLIAAWSRGLLPFDTDDWLRLQSIRGILDAIDEHRENQHEQN